MTRMPPFVSAIVACLAALASSAAFADEYASDWARSSKAEARLIAGAPREAGVEVRLAPGAITYWRNPGDAGVPPRFDFAGSRNLASAEPAYPAPNRIAESDGSEAFGYQDEVVFPIAVAATDASQPVELALQFNYAVCEKLCIPARATLKLTLPAAGASPYAASLAAARAETPHASELAALGGELTALGADAWRLCAPAEQGPQRDLFIEAPGGWWLTSHAEPAADGRACFTLALRDKPSDAALPVEVGATLTGGAAPREFKLTLAPKG
jgi:DsbC/DsbD-like thiol-disulfide interchange protein